MAKDSTNLGHHSSCSSWKARNTGFIYNLITLMAGDSAREMGLCLPQPWEETRAL
jgi:hypothetical protein